MNVHRYAPLSVGAFQDMLTALEHAGWKRDDESPRSSRMTSSDGNVKIKLVTDEDELRVQLLKGTDAPGFWNVIDEAIGQFTHVHGDEKTRWDALAGELAALDAATVVGEYIDNANGERGPMVAGEPKTKTFSLTPDEVQKLLDGARGKGFDVTKTGESSFAIDTHTAGVKLSASYDASSQTATITITNADFYVPNSKVWEKIQPLMPQHVQGAGDAAATAATPAATDAEGHVSYLEMAEQKVRNAWDKAQELDAAAKKKTREKAAAALDTAKDLAKDVEQGLRAGGGAIHDRAVAIKEKLKDTAKEIAPWYLAIGVGTWLLIGGVAWFVYEEQKKSGRAAGKELASAL